MNSADNLDMLDPATAFDQWFGRFVAAIGGENVEALARTFAVDGHWKDLLAFTWEHRIFAGREAIAEAFAATLGEAHARNFRVAAKRPAPAAARRSRRDVVEAYFEFDTDTGPCTSFVRLREDDGEYVAWILLTTLQGLHGFEEKTGNCRPTGDQYAMNVHGRNWLEDQEDRRAFTDREPEVIVVGAGHAGLAAAARLRQLGVDALVVEKLARVGDVWRNRYRSLTLHNEIMANHLPYMSFPKTWPMWLSKDQLANWLEIYAECMELNVWTSTEMCGAKYDEEDRRWSVRLRLADGSVIEKHCRHIIVASGVSGSIPHRPELDGLAEFKGEVLHSSDYRDGATLAGRSVLVVGTGNSGHDVAQDLHVKGARQVAMLQRGPTCVISLKPGASMIYAIYGGDRQVEDVDLVAAAMPYPLLRESYRWITKKAAALDNELLDGLKSRGFKTYFGSDDTGFQMMYMRGEGGYYIDVGCSELIANGSVDIIQAEDVRQINAEGLAMNNGETRAFDAIVLATGFKNMQENIRAMFGDEIADRVGKVWGFDEDFQMRSMWRRTGQEGLWITGGSLLDSRIFSRFMALEIKADLEGVLPARKDLPLRRSPPQALRRAG